MAAVQKLQITITNGNPNPNGNGADVKAGGTVKWFGAGAAYSLTLPTDVFDGVTNPVSVPENGWTSEFTVKSTANGQANYTITEDSGSGLLGGGQPSIMVSP